MDINEVGPDGLDIEGNGIGDLGQYNGLMHINELGVYILH